MHMLTDMYQHNLKWLSFRKRCKHRLLCLAQNTLLIGKPGYLNNLLKRRVILTHIRTSDTILLEGGTTRHASNSHAFSSIVPRTWNSLPYDLRKIQYSYCFNIKLKNHFNSI